MTASNCTNCPGDTATPSMIETWARLDRIFTDDATFDMTDLGVPLLEGLTEIRRFMDEDAQHPKTHTMTNIYVDADDDGVRLNFRIVALLRGGLAGTASYYGPT